MRSFLQIQNSLLKAFIQVECNGIEVDLMSGALPQNKRIKLIQKIKEGKIKALIATDVASRGLHISSVSHVYNFDIPDDPSNYIHRIGRTARAGATGTATSLVCDDYGQNFPAVVELLGDADAISCEWYSESYLQIEDKAGDPFANRKEAERPKRDSRPERNSRPERKGADAAGRGPKPKGNKKPQDRNKRDAKGGRDQNRKKPHHKSAKGKPQPKTAAPAPAAASSVGGLFKNMVKAIFR